MERQFVHQFEFLVSCYMRIQSHLMQSSSSPEIEQLRLSFAGRDPLFPTLVQECTLVHPPKTEAHLTNGLVARCPRRSVL